MTARLAAQLRRWRHDLHRIPETGFAEHRTGDYLAAALEDMGLEVTRGVGGTGLVATVRGEAGDRAIIVVVAQIVLALQTIVARNLDPAESGVVSCTEVTTDGARNAIPGTAVLRGDTRSFTPSARALVEQRLRAISSGIAEAHGATAEVSYTHEFEPTVNDHGVVELALAAARMSVGDDRVDPDTAPITASEDFGLLSRAVPGCFAFLGNGETPRAGGTPLHSPDYDFNDDILTTGVTYYRNLARTVLA